MSRWDCVHPPDPLYEQMVACATNPQRYRIEHMITVAPNTISGCARAVQIIELIRPDQESNLGLPPFKQGALVPLSYPSGCRVEGIINSNALSLTTFPFIIEFPFES